MNEAGDRGGLRGGKERYKGYLPPDDTIFEETVFDFDVLKRRLREMAFLTKG